MAGALLEAYGTAGASLVIEAVPLAWAQLDDGVFGAGTVTAVALETVSAGKATPRLIGRFGFGQPGDDFLEAAKALRQSQLILLKLIGLGEIPEVQLIVSYQGMFRR